MMDPRAVVTQQMPKVSAGLYVGTGKAEEIRIAFPLCHGAGIMEAVVPGGNHAEPGGNSAVPEDDPSEKNDYPAEYWRTGAYGIREPVPELAVPVKPEDIDLVIVPCVAFDGRQAGSRGGVL